MTPQEINDEFKQKQTRFARMSNPSIHELVLLLVSFQVYEKIFCLNEYESIIKSFKNSFPKNRYLR